MRICEAATLMTLLCKIKTNSSPGCQFPLTPFPPSHPPNSQPQMVIIFFPQYLQSNPLFSTPSAATTFQPPASLRRLSYLHATPSSCRPASATCIQRELSNCEPWNFIPQLNSRQCICMSLGEVWTPKLGDQTLACLSGHIPPQSPSCTTPQSLWKLSPGTAKPESLSHLKARVMAQPTPLWILEKGSVEA